MTAARKSAAAEFGKDIYYALKAWMERYSDKSIVPVQTKLYGADGKLQADRQGSEDPLIQPQIWSGMNPSFRRIE